jgi:hypothetical protein
MGDTGIKVIITALLFVVPFVVGIIGKIKEVKQIIVFALVFLSWELVPVLMSLIMLPFNEFKEAIQDSYIGNITLLASPFCLVLTLVVMMVLYGETNYDQSIEEKEEIDRLFEQYRSGPDMSRAERMMEEREKEIKDYQDRFNDR